MIEIKISEEQATAIRNGEPFALVGPKGETCGQLNVENRPPTFVPVTPGNFAHRDVVKLFRDMEVETAKLEAAAST